jgi:polyisoprenoid-binding protein YceI
MPRLNTLVRLSILAAAPLVAEDTTLIFDPPQTQVHWTLGTVLHTVHGTFQLRSGTVHFDPSTGKAGGALTVEARSGESGSDSRDSRMHNSILESAKFPEIVFVPDRVDGRIPAQGAATLQVHGVFRLHGADHEFTLPVQVSMDPNQATITTAFHIPYIRWGLKNPSTFILRVDDHVDIDIHAVGRISNSGGH